MAEYSISAI